MKISFMAQAQSKNENGVYTVLADPVGGKMTVRYNDGTVKLLNVDKEIKNLIAYRKENIVKVKDVEIKFNEDFYIAVGFLAFNSFVFARMPESDFSEFQMSYFESTGEVIEQEDSALEFNNAGWGLEMRLIFPKFIFDHLQLPFEKLIAEELNNSFKCSLSNVKVIKHLLNLGFRMGNNHNVENILEMIPSQYRAGFELGYSTARCIVQEKIQGSLMRPVRLRG